MRSTFYAALASVATAILFAPVNAQSGITDCAREYQVQSGDFCDGISAAQHVSTWQLLNVNKVLVNPLCTNLFVDQWLCLGIEGQDCDTVHVVASGDFCAKIAEDAEIDLEVLLTNNPNIDEECSNIYIGQVVCTAPDVIPYTS